ncbi:MAG TPA: SRPBCC family protein [Marmoricola sp.]|jgi:uncharacterized protein YndB with AHSA1/START domain|nr:SRPBCC family protein [Marmoricola sp.]
MATNKRLIHATPDKVWRVLSDGWLYPVWVVGASRMREVDETWPAVGSRLHHSVGVWPALVNDYTEARESEPRGRLVLRARVWPYGEASVHIELSPADEGTAADGTEVTIHEKIEKGPTAYLPGPLEGLGMKWRNSETLRRLAFIAERSR